MLPLFSLAEMPHATHAPSSPMPVTLMAPALLQLLKALLSPLAMMPPAAPAELVLLTVMLTLLVQLLKVLLVDTAAMPAM